jgi:iron only hydrogenase large subunit-like protein/urease beta subunit
MRKLITNDLDKCVGCNRCIRTCPVEEANIAYIEEGKTKVKVDNSKCIACGACLLVCRHGSRSFVDDTERFFADLARGERISIFCAPAGRTNLGQWDQVLALLRQKGVNKIYDASLGADICTWAYIRYIQKNNPKSLITQPCPAIVDYILHYRNELLPYLSPVHSPMLCTAIYMRRYQNVTEKIAAISPCIAKANEFEETGDLVSYNITFARLAEYIQKNKLALPRQGSGFDHVDSGLGAIYSMPGGLKENVEYMLGKDLRIDKSEGQAVVYGALDAFGKENTAHLPAIFDVLNCPEGCNLGTGCQHEKSFFEVNASMDEVRQNITGRGHEYMDELYAKFDHDLRLPDFIRRYAPKPVRCIPVTEVALEKAFQELGKPDESSRQFNCGACGSDTCRGMAVKIVKKVNFPHNCIQCIQKAYVDMSHKHDSVVSWRQHTAGSIQSIREDIMHIKEMSDKIVHNVGNVDAMIGVYDAMAKDIDKIASNIHMISLNASIEAARAGEHGRSFAVVADAIRTLAGETQEATSKIIRATSDAKTALGGISDMVVDIGGAISESHENVSAIAASTEDVLKD